MGGGNGLTDSNPRRTRAGWRAVAICIFGHLAEPTYAVQKTSPRLNGLAPLIPATRPYG